MAVRPFTALVVGTRPELRSTLSSRLRRMGAIEVTEAGTGAETRAALADGSGGELGLVDLDVAEGGLALLREVRAAGWRRLLVLVDGPGDPGIVRAAFAAGATGLYCTGTPVATADLSVPRLVGGTATRPGAGPGGVGDLSAREVEVLRLVADGQSNKEVGDHLGLSALTVKSHLARIARKLGTGDRAEMVALALRGGVIE